MSAPERVLVRAPNWLGDVVLSLGALRDVRRNFAGARLLLLARPAVAEIYRAVEGVDELRVARSFAEEVEAQRGACDVSVLLPNSFGSAAAAWRAGVAERWGYATDGRGPLLTRRARVPAGARGQSEVYYYRAMLAAVGLEVSAAPDTSLRCPAEWAERARALLGEGDVIGLAAGAAFGGAKRWIGERFAAVGDALARETGARVVFVGGPGEREAALGLAGSMSRRPQVLCGETGLAELMGVISRLRLLVCNDSGPMHLAAALGTPVAAVFGSTDWRETAPRGARARVLRAEGVACAPCKLRECPIDHACMRGVDAATVARAAAELLG